MKTIKFILCVVVGTMLMIGVNSCDDKKKAASASESSKENTEKSEKSENSESVNDESSSASASTEGVNPKSGKLVLLDFYATWCGPCKEMEPVMEQMEKKYSENLEFRKVDIDKDRKIAEKYRIKAVPTYVILSPTGEEIDRMEGSCDEERMDETLWEIINYHTVK